MSVCDTFPKKRCLSSLQVRIMDFFGSVPRVAASHIASAPEAAAGSSSGLDAAGGSSGNAPASIPFATAGQTAGAAALDSAQLGHGIEQATGTERMPLQSAALPDLRHATDVAAGWELQQKLGSADPLLLLGLAVAVAAALVASRRSSNRTQSTA